MYFTDQGSLVHVVFEAEPFLFQ